jgi:hypothetical protein
MVCSPASGIRMVVICSQIRASAITIERLKHSQLVQIERKLNVVIIFNVSPLQHHHNHFQSLLPRGKLE